MSRPPVVTILVHRGSRKNFAAGRHPVHRRRLRRSWRITQKIGAYQVMHKNRLITFLDTPGHAAFTPSARGAREPTSSFWSSRPTTVSCPKPAKVGHARAARVPIVVALNKIDKTNANPDRVKHQLSELGLVPDDYGGDTLVVPVSAKNGPAWTTCWRPWY